MINLKMKIIFIFIVILYNFLSFTKNYQVNLTFFFIYDNNLVYLKIGDTEYSIKQQNLIDIDEKLYESNYIIEMYSGEIINAKFTTN